MEKLWSKIAIFCLKVQNLCFQKWKMENFCSKIYNFWSKFENWSSKIENFWSQIENFWSKIEIVIETRNLFKFKMLVENKIISNYNMFSDIEILVTNRD